MSFGGPPPGGFGGPPPDGSGGFGGPPPDGSGGFGGPPPGGYGGPPPGGMGGPPMGGPFGPPPQGGPFGASGGPFAMAAPPPKKSGSSLPLILGLGCGGLLLLAIIGGAVGFFVMRRSAPPPPPISYAPPAATAPPAPTLPAKGDLKAELRDMSPIKSKYGKSMRFVGEIHNTGTGAIGYPAAKVTFYDDAGTAVDSGTCASIIRVLAPGDRIPCGFSIFKGLTWSTYKVDLVPFSPTYRGQIAEIDISDIKFTPKRGYKPDTLEGKLTNKSAFKAKHVWAIVTLYDDAKKIVGTDNALVAGSDLDAGQSGLFSAKVYEVAGTPASYRVIAVGYSD
ncbi:MAG: FxLYD domain-containing protein [Polyangiaceae bacterium]